MADVQCRLEEAVETAADRFDTALKREREKGELRVSVMGKKGRRGTQGDTNETSFHPSERGVFEHTRAVARFHSLDDERRSRL